MLFSNSNKNEEREEIERLKKENEALSKCKLELAQEYMRLFRLWRNCKEGLVTYENKVLKNIDRLRSMSLEEIAPLLIREQYGYHHLVINMIIMMML